MSFQKVLSVQETFIAHHNMEHPVNDNVKTAEDSDIVDGLDLNQMRLYSTHHMSMNKLNIEESSEATTESGEGIVNGINTNDENESDDMQEIHHIQNDQTNKNVPDNKQSFDSLLRQFILGRTDQVGVRTVVWSIGCNESGQHGDGTKRNASKLTANHWTKNIGIVKVISSMNSNALLLPNVNSHSLVLFRYMKCLHILYRYHVHLVCVQRRIVLARWFESGRSIRIAIYPETCDENAS